VTSSPWTLPRALEAAARSAEGLHFVQEDGSEAFASYERLLLQAGSIARHLARHGIGAGQRVAILVPEAEGFVPSLFGVAMAGAAAVPLAPPLSLTQLGASLDSWRRMVRLAGVRAILTTPRLRPLLGTLPADAPAIRGIWEWDDLVREGGEHRADVRPDSPALVQFTSGSTSHPKGVVLTHANLGANVAAITGPSGLGARADDVGVSWLPLFHDMGLIGIVLSSVDQRRPSVLLPPLLFLKRPAAWLRAITRHRGTVSFAPNFAYDLCVRRAGRDVIEGLDLSSWRVAGCGAEPIHPATLEAFAKAFAPAGFRRDAFLPCYGLAEHTLAATFHRVGEPLRVDHVRADALRDHRRATACAPGDPGAARFVSCGQPFPGHEVRIVGGDDRVLPERHVGEIQLRGPSVMAGYEHDPAQTRQVLRHGWLRTGDLGYLAEGDLFPCGRKKDLIIVHGRNYYPQDLEWVAGEAVGVRRGSVAAFGIVGPEGDEQVVIVAEARGRTAEAEVAASIRRRVQETTGLHVHDVLIAGRGAIPRTTSGKIQRARLKARYAAGQLHVERRTEGGLLRHLISSRWGYTRAALRRLAGRLAARGVLRGTGTPYGSEPSQT
jgi:fatty-acyl-CoA synthase